MLKATHLSRRLSACSWKDIEPGWFVRFSGDSDRWAELKDELKSWGWECARWVPVYEWDDGKLGAWWVKSYWLDDLYSWLPNLEEAAYYLDNDEIAQCIWRRVYWYMSCPAQQTKQQESKRAVPIWLQSDYQMLELPDRATLQDVKSAYRRLSKVYHPDLGGTHDGFIQLKKSYEHVASWVEMKERIAG